MLSPFSQALATCPSDTRNTTPTVPNKGLPPDYLCLGLPREQNRFWQDAHNSVWTNVKHGGGGNSPMSITTRTWTACVMFDRPPVCDPLGQCITVTAVTTFNTLISIGQGVSIALRTSVQSYQLVSRLPSGASKVTIYMKSHMPRYPLDVPATTTDDGEYARGRLPQQ